jgi:hypothetical protein
MAISEDKLQEAFSALYTDLLMLQDGDWEPDFQSVDASLDILANIADYFDIPMVDNRDT